MVSGHREVTTIVMLSRKVTRKGSRKRGYYNFDGKQKDYQEVGHGEVTIEHYGKDAGWESGE